MYHDDFSLKSYHVFAIYVSLYMKLNSIQACICLISVISIMTESNLGRENFISFTVHVTVHYWKKSEEELKPGRNTEAVTDTKTIEKRSNIIFLTWISSLFYLYQ